MRSSRDEYDALLADPIGEGTRSSILAQNEAASASGPRGFVALRGQLPFQAVKGAGFV